MSYSAATVTARRRVRWGKWVGASSQAAPRRTSYVEVQKRMHMHKIFNDSEHTHAQPYSAHRSVGATAGPIDWGHHAARVPCLAVAAIQVLRHFCKAFRDLAQRREPGHRVQHGVARQVHQQLLGTQRGREDLAFRKRARTTHSHPARVSAIEKPSVRRIIFLEK